MNNKWVEELKPGDIVSTGIMSDLRGFTPMETSTVERTTKTLIVLSNGERYRKCSGREYGSNHWWPRIIRPVRKGNQQ